MKPLGIVSVSFFHVFLPDTSYFKNFLLLLWHESLPKFYKSLSKTLKTKQWKNYR